MQIESTTGGMWRYPLKLIALEPPPDDTITIEVTRLNREFLVGFRLSSKIEYLFILKYLSDFKLNY